jgi:hypothetical protein
MTDFEIMQEMGGKNMDIRMTGTVIGAQQVKAGGHITFGVDSATFQIIINQMATGETTHYVAMYVVNKEQFDKIKQQKP